MDRAAQIKQLTSMLENLQAQAKERQVSLSIASNDSVASLLMTSVLNLLYCVTCQQEGELNEKRLPGGLTGERTIFRRRQQAPPELGAAQIKPKRIRFVFDLSASMYTLQYDGRLDREIKTCLMVLEAFARADKGRFKWDIVGHSGDQVIIPLVKADKFPTNDGQRYEILRSITAYTQYCDSGDNTLASIKKSVEEVATDEAD
ncbi:hypothetical protein CF319_g8659, partial [Tilletia indica]